MRDIVNLFAAAFGILIAFAPALIGGVLKSRTGTRALVSSGAGVACAVIAVFIIPREAFLVAAAVSTAVYVAPEKRS